MPASAQLRPVARDVVPPASEDAAGAASDRHVFVVCNGESCRHAGSGRLLGLLRHECTHQHGRQDVRVSSSKCIGRCAAAPAMVEDGRVMGWVSLRRLKSELSRLGLVPTAS
jgi:NADH:ubiquinone oxidoreductase subunit E